MAQQLSGLISNIVQGDNLDITRTIGTLPAPISKCWFTVKTNAKLSSTTDTAPNVVFQKVITTANIVGSGVILDSGGSGTASVRFELINADTILLVGDTVYYYDIQVLTTTGAIYTPELGLIKTKKERTKAVA